METVTMEGGNNNIIIYERENEQATAYHKDTPLKVRAILEQYLQNYRRHDSRSRLRIFYGDTETGRDWHEEWQIIGYIGRSNGKIKVPLLIFNSRSNGGGSILDHCIIKIMEGKRVLYQHPKYDAGKIIILPCTMAYFKAEVRIDGKVHARFRTEAKAQRWFDFMTGKRMSK